MKKYQSANAAADLKIKGKIFNSISKTAMAYFYNT